MSRLIKLERTDMDNRDTFGALVYIDGQLFVASTHARAIHNYLISIGSEGLFDSGSRPRKYDQDTDVSRDTKQDKMDIEEIENNINQLAFAHINSNNMTISIEEFNLQNVDIQTVANTIKKEYPDYDIVNDDTEKKVAKLSRLKNNLLYKKNNEVTTC